MNCPHCNNDLSELETYDNILKAHECPQCHNDIWLEYDEFCLEDFSECWDEWTWHIIEKGNKD